VEAPVETENSTESEDFLESDPWISPLQGRGTSQAYTGGRAL
jgi:hypothetical protein